MCLFDKFYAATNELGKCFAFEQSVLKECEVDELRNCGALGGEGCQAFVEFLFFGCYGIGCFLLLLLFVVGEFVVFLLFVGVVHCGFARLEPTHFALNLG